MDKYIIVKVRNAEAKWPPYPHWDVERKRYMMPFEAHARMRQAIHAAYKTEAVNGADMVTHSPWMTKDESETVKRIFETAMARAKGVRYDG